VTSQHWMLQRLVINENRWRAQRHGYDRGLVDFGKGRVVDYAELLDEILDLVREDAERLDCVAEVEGAREILHRGTSAHRQIAVFNDAKTGGASDLEALQAVVDWLIGETLHGVSTIQTATE